MVTFKQKGDFKRLDKFLERSLEFAKLGELDKYGKMGVKALSEATPVDTGETAASWYYTIERNENGVSIVWSNSSTNKGYLIAILLQYGHGTRSGVFVSGVDYINKALTPVFNSIAESAWKEVMKS